jgi:hypothetical protein
MINFQKLVIFLLCVGSLAGCATGKVQTVKFDNGDIFQGAVIADGATELVPWTFTNVQTGVTDRGVLETDSMSARVWPGTAQVITGGVINGQYAKDISRHSGGGNGGSQLINNNTVQVQSEATLSGSGGSTGCATCGLVD